MPEVQILLMSYNRAAYLEQAVESVLAQTYRDYHVLIVDDASTDGTAELAVEYERRNPGRVTALIKQERRGYADSLRVGLGALSGAEYLAMLDDDDLWHTRKLEAQLQAFARRPELGLVATEAEIIDAAGEAVGQLFSQLHGRPDLERPARDIFWNGNSLASSSVLISRAALSLITPYQPHGDGCNDMELWLAIAAHLPIAWLEEPLTYVRHSPGQMTERKLATMWRESYLLRERAYCESPAVRNAVGGAQARRRLDGDLVYWARWHVREGNWPEFVWYARRTLSRRNPGLAVLLAYFSCVGVAESMLRSSRSRRHRRER